MIAILMAVTMMAGSEPSASGVDTPPPTVSRGACPAQTQISVHSDGRVLLHGGADGGRETVVAPEDLGAAFNRAAGPPSDRGQEVWICTDPDAPFVVLLSVINGLADYGFWLTHIAERDATGSPVTIHMSADAGFGDRPCVVTAVSVAPGGRVSVLQVKGGLYRRWRGRRVATTPSGLAQTLASLHGNTCAAIVHAAANAPVHAVLPAFATLSASGFKDFASEDSSLLAVDPGWERAP
ncbi:MAG: hypothetical protein JWP35_2859 [Caulobacter sp.]|nr:hypothetical protein [Caulobacter sp.]